MRVQLALALERGGDAAGDEPDGGDHGHRGDRAAAQRRPEGDDEADERGSARRSTANTAGPLVFDRNSMIRLNE